MNISRLIQLNQKADQLLEFDRPSAALRMLKPLGGAALKYGGIGAGVGAVTGGISGALSDDPDRTMLGGALKGGLEGGALGALGGAAVRGGKIASRLKGLKKFKAAGQAGYNVPGAGGMGGMPPLSARHDRLVQLSSNLETILLAVLVKPGEDLTGKPNLKGQRPEDNMRRGVGMGLLAGGPQAALSGGLEASAYTKAGAVLRKRDVYGHEIVGAAGGGVGGVAGGALGGLFGPRGRAVGAGIGTLAGYGAARYGISKHTLTARKAELKRGYQV